MTGRLAGKTAIVTGAGRGIGSAIALAFAKEGANVAVWEKDLTAGQATQNKCLEAGYQAKFFACDVTDRDAISAAYSETTSTFGPSDILVNNAGVNVFHEPLNMPDDEWDRCMKLDLNAAWWCAKEVLPDMRKRGKGSIINIASTHSFQIIPGTFPYPVAKHALIGLTKSLAIEYAADRIRVNAIAPGYIETGVGLEYWAGFDDPEEARQRVCEMLPPNRVGKPDEVAMTAVFLASDEATFINAETIMIDGGQTALYHQ